MQREKEIRHVTVLGAVVNVVLTIGKIVAGVVGRSAAMVADGIHSLSDLLSDVVVIVFTHLSSKGKDKEHSFGHGKFETLATIIISVILVAVGASLMSSGVKSIIDVLGGGVIPEPSYIALVAAAVSIVSKEWIYRVTVKVGKRVGSTVVIANAWHHRSDALSSIGSLVGIGGAILLGDKWTLLDPLASCVISVAIIVVAVKMALPSLAELLETALPPGGGGGDRKHCLGSGRGQRRARTEDAPQRHVLYHRCPHRGQPRHLHRGGTRDSHSRGGGALCKVRAGDAAQHPRGAVCGGAVRIS